MQAPVVEKKPQSFTEFGKTRIDDYFWLRDKDNPEVIKYLEAENAYTDSLLARHSDLADELFNEIKGRISERDESVPVKDGDFWYGSRFEEGKEHKVYFRRRGGPRGPETTLLDMNELAKGKDTFELGAFSWSPCHRFLAYSIDDDGSESFTIRIKDLNSDTLLADEIKGSLGDIVWDAHSESVFYTLLDDNHRPFMVKQHRLREPVDCDRVVFRETDGRFFVGVEASQSGQYVFISSEGNNSSEVMFLASGVPDADPVVVDPRRKNVEYSVYHQGTQFLKLTNEDALDFRVMAADLTSTSEFDWREKVPHTPGRLIVGIRPFATGFATMEKENASERVRVFLGEDSVGQVVQLADAAGKARFGYDVEYNTRTLRIEYTSLVTPETTMAIDLETGALEVLKVREVPSGYDRSKYKLSRVNAVSHDGVQVPITILSRADHKLDGSQPAYLYAYGSYGIGITPGFSATYLSLADRGVAVAIAHIRGGDDLGRGWYESGKMLRKKNTFLDFIACAETMINEGWTKPDRLAICGGSAGGLLMGAVANMRPELFKVVAAHVPFVDCLNTMLDDTLPLTKLEYNEWGNPNDQRYYEYIKSYSPYDNVEAKDYPHFFISSGLNDPRVTYWEPTKWVAKLRDMKTDGNELVLKTNMASGHRGKSGRYESIKESAEELSFILAKIIVK